MPWLWHRLGVSLGKTFIAPVANNPAHECHWYKIGYLAIVSVGNMGVMLVMLGPVREGLWADLRTLQIQDFTYFMNKRMLKTV